MGSRKDLPVEPLQDVPALRELVRERLEALIISGAIEPGERLIDNELARDFGTSRGPVREALQLLEHDGWVDLHPRKGAFVHVPTEKEIDDFFGLRRALEMEAARLAALNITDKEARELRDVVAKGQEALAMGRDPYPDLDHGALHTKIVAIADNADLSEVLEVLKKRGRWYLTPLGLSRRQGEWEEHVEVVEAICRRDPATAAAEMGQHIDASRDAYKLHRQSSPGGRTL